MRHWFWKYGNSNAVARSLGQSDYGAVVRVMTKERELTGFCPRTGNKSANENIFQHFVGKYSSAAERFILQRSGIGRIAHKGALTEVLSVTVRFHDAFIRCVGLE